MKKTHLICLGICLASLGSIAQESVSAQSTKSPVAEIHKALKPADASPYVFTTKEELNAKKQEKLNATHDLIDQNKDNAVMVRELRMNLWRIENAVVAEPKK